jgi:hypothetical protein
MDIPCACPLAATSAIFSFAVQRGILAMKRLLLAILALVATVRVVEQTAFSQTQACAAPWRVGMPITTGQVLSFGGHNWKALQPETQTQTDWTPPNVPALWADAGACTASTTPPQPCVAPWTVGVPIAVGEVLSFGGQNWQAIQPEIQTQANWAPPNVPALWVSTGVCTPSPAPDSNGILGFESPAGWIVNGKLGIALQASATRTQGNFALAVVGSSGRTSLTSLPVGSTARALSGIGQQGALFEVDVKPPFANAGTLQLFVSSTSSGVAKKLAGEINLGRFRPGIFTTVQVPIPDDVRTALGSTKFNDLIFELDLNSPQSASTFMFDNLRVHSVPLVTGTAGIKPPAGFGGSVDLIAIGNTPAAQTFDIGPVQVPDSFHLKLGTAGATTVQLALGFDGTPANTCTYFPDSADTTGTSYALNFCTGGLQAGDLVGSNWAKLTIVGGDGSMKIRAQLARRPVGDLLGAGVIPAMPTFWGDFDACVPAPVAGQVITQSPSCNRQVAAANQIVTNYFNKVSSANTAPNWVVTPVPEFARRHGDGSPNDNLLGLPPPPNDPPFDQEGHVNPGGSFDAYWRLNGALSSANTPTQNTAHLDATFGAHVVLFGEDADVVSLNTVIDTSQGTGTFSTCQNTRATSPGAAGCLHMFLFGNEIAGGGDRAPQTGFNFSFTETQDFDLPPIPIWIFEITLGASASVGVNASGTLAVTGFDVSIAPTATLGAHIFGGINLGIASGGVDARINLLNVSTPIKADAGWFIDTDPTACSADLKFSLNGQAQISAGGGEVDLVASFGICPFCVDGSLPLISWPPIASTTKTLFDFPINAQLFGLPPAACNAPLSVFIANPPATSVPANVPIPLSGSARSVPGGNPVPCDNFQWVVNPPDTLNPPSGRGCNVTVTFADPSPAPTASRTLRLNASFPFVNQFGTIQTSGSASESVNVSLLPPGPHIISATSLMIRVPPPSPLDGKEFAIVSCGLTPIQLTGTVVGQSGTVSWSAVNRFGGVFPVGTGLTPSWNITEFGIYTVTMTDSVAGSVSMSVVVDECPRSPKQ